ncbi:MAG TPA: o-succinylbenzoate--CoA ligase [Roseiflexaceae bacterium]|nr:o-succinylbenzoate--CoA ligase [Roseiflexaceae bacterium]
MINQSHMLPNWLAQRAAVLPEQLALLGPGARWTFAELDRQASSMARALLAYGAAPGDRVALLLRNGSEFAALAHAAPRAGLVLVPLNSRLSAPELAWQLADAGARLLLYDSATAALAEAVLAHAADHGALAAANTADLRGAPADQPALRGTIDLAETYTIIYTSGTTGRPKGAQLIYGNYWWSAVGSALNLGNHAGDRWLAVLPLFHVGGLSILVRAAIYGIPAVIHSAFDPAAANRAIDEDGVTIVSVVSAMLQRMLDERGDRPYPASLRCVLLGGGPAPRPLLEACAARGVPVVQTYGLTETASQVATLAPADALRKLGSAGQPLLPTELRIARADQAGIGEILVRGPTVMAGYINRPDETELALRDGWLHTGDLGYLDQEGYLYVVSRRHDLIISGGENIYPAEVEAVLLAHPAVEEAAVAGLPDARWGQVPAAAIKLRPGMQASAAELIEFCRGRLANYKVPKQVRLVAALPRNATGKLLRDAVLALLVA